MALQQNRVIKVNFLPDSISLLVDKYSDPIKLQNEFMKKTAEKRDQLKFKDGDRVIFKLKSGTFRKAKIVLKKDIMV